MFENPRVLVFSPVLSGPYSSSSGCFADIRAFALFILAFSSVDEVTKMFLVDCVFDVEPRGEFRSGLNDPTLDVSWQVSLQRVFKTVDNVLTCFTSVGNFYHQQFRFGGIFVGIFRVFFRVVGFSF